MEIQINSHIDLYTKVQYAAIKATQITDYLD